MSPSVKSESESDVECGHHRLPGSRGAHCLQRRHGEVMEQQHIDLLSRSSIRPSVDLNDGQFAKKLLEPIVFLLLVASLKRSKRM